MRAAALICLLVLSSAGLVVLGLSASDAAEAKARLNARELLDGLARSLSTAMDALLADADREADRWTPETGAGERLAGVFVLDASGRLRHPAVSSFPAFPPPAEGEVERVRAYLNEAEGLDRESAERLLETAAFEEFSHPDLVGVLLLRLADRDRREGNRERAAFRYRSIAEDLPAARDLEGSPIAPQACLRLLAMRDDPEKSRPDAERFGLRLADRAWSLSSVERDLMLDRVAAASPGGKLPEKVARRRAFVDAFTPAVRAVAAAEAAPGWRHTVSATRSGFAVFGFRRLTAGGEKLVFGYCADAAGLRAGLATAARELAARDLARVEIGLATPVVAGADPGNDPLVREVRLLDRIPAAVAISPPGGFGRLKALHVATTLLLAASLLTGILLSLRAVRLEIRTARLRQNLLDNTSHELRTPLTTIRMYAEMLADEELPPEKESEYLGWILGEAERLDLLVGEILDLSRLGAEGTPFPVEPVDPAEIATAAVKRVEGPAGDARVTVDLPPDLPRVLADRGAAVHALSNLLVNARKYSEGAIGIEGVRAADFIRLEVWDRGPGISPADQEHLFTRFYRSPRDARKVKGVGIGLTLAREIARLQGGDVILVESSPEGSRFALCLRAAGRDEP